MTDFDGRLRSAGDRLQGGDEGPALAMLADCRDEPHVRVHVAKALGAMAVRVLDRLQARQDVEPDEPDLWLLTGAAQVEAGYRARGFAVSSLVSDNQAHDMLHQANLADQSLRRAAKLLPDDPAPWVVLMTGALVAGGGGLVREAWQEVLARGGGEIYEANRVRLVSLTRKWYGSGDECFAFARERVEGLPPGHPLHALVALAHVEAFVGGLMSGVTPVRLWHFYTYLRRPGVRAEIGRASKALLAESDEFAGHPAMPEAHQAFACVYFVAGAHRRARPHLKRSRIAVAFPWRYFGDPGQLFHRALIKAR